MRTWFSVLTPALVLVMCTHVMIAGQPRWQVIANLPAATSHHRTVMLVDGAVFTTGGLLADGRVSDQTVLVDPLSGALRNLPALPLARAAFACVTVSRANITDVYVIGGYTGTTGAYASSSRVDRFTYDAATRSGTWRTLGNLDLAVGDCRAAFDGNGSIVVTGGHLQSTGQLSTGVAQQHSWSISTTTGAIQRLGDLTLRHAAHTTLRFVDQQGRYGVLTAGGEQPSSTTVTELLINGLWDSRTNPPRQYREHGASLTDRGEVARVFGGLDAAGVPLAVCEWYDPKSGWRAAPRMTFARAHHDAARIDGPSDTANAVLVVGGRTAAASLRSTELYLLPSSTDPVGSWESLPDLVVPASDASSSMSTWNLPAVTGGSSGSPNNLVQMLQPLRAANVSMPSTEVSALSDSVFLDVVNTWILPVHIDRVAVDGTAEFLVVGALAGGETIPAGGTKRYLVYFRPSTEGLRQSRILFHMGPVTDTVSISGIGLRSTVSLTTSGIDVGEVIVGTQRDTCLPLVINQGTDTLRIDSMIISDPDVTVISPLGRVKVPPGETLTVCLRYRPSARQVLAATMSVHVGARLLPVSVIGRGVRRFVVVQSSVDCDTISAKPGDDVQLVVQVLNPSDRTVTITAIAVNSTTSGTVTLDPSMTFPVDVAPNAGLPVLLIQRIVRESREDITLTCTDNGDSLARGTVCTVPRSRTLQLSTSSIDLGTVCGGTTIERSIRIDNASTVEAIQIDAVNISGLAGSTDLTLPITLQPRQSIDVTLLIALPVTGPVNGQVSFDGPNGSAVARITGTIAPTLDVRLDDATMITGLVGRQDLRATAQTPATFTLAIMYPWRLLSPKAVSASDVPATSIIGNITSSGIYEITVSLSRVPLDGESVVRIDYDVLRADALEALVATGPTASAPCVVADSSIVTIEPYCGSSAGFVYLSTAPMMLASADGSGMVIRVLNTEVDGILNLHSLHGELIQSAVVDTNVVSISLRDVRGPLALTYVGSDGLILRTLHLQP